MIACDNDVSIFLYLPLISAIQTNVFLQKGREVEWFHLPCVHLTGLPNKKAKWYCPSCRVELSKGVFSFGIVGGNF